MPPIIQPRGIREAERLLVNPGKMVRAIYAQQAGSFQEPQTGQSLYYNGTSYVPGYAVAYDSVAGSKVSPSCEGTGDSDSNMVVIPDMAITRTFSGGPCVVMFNSDFQSQGSTADVTRWVDTDLWYVTPNTTAAKEIGQGVMTAVPDGATQDSAENAATWHFARTDVITMPAGEWTLFYAWEVGSNGSAIAYEKRRSMALLEFPNGYQEG